MDAGYIILII